MTDRTRKFAEFDRNFIWHPFTQMKEYENQEPIVIEEGDGVYLIDTEGRRYIDGVSSLWVTIHGHRVPEIDRAIKEQVDKIGHSTLLGITNIAAAELARELIEICPEGLTRVFYSGDGASAVEVALKMAFQYWQHKGKPKKTKFVSLENGYHGDTLGAVSVGGIDLFHAAYKPLLFETYKAPSYYCYRCPLGKTYPSCEIACAKEVEKILEEHHEEIAAVIFEPYVQAAGGMIVSPPGYLKEIRAFCDKYDMIMILDEVATGFGRTGMMFACEHEDVSPDIMVLGKGMTGGYLPLSATVVTQKIYDVFLGEYDEFKTFFHGHSYSGNPISCAAALGNIEVFKKDNTLEKLREKIEFLERELQEFKGLEHVGDVRNKGFMVGIELVEDRETKTPYPLKVKMGWRVAEFAMQEGVLIRPLGNVVVLMPPIGISKEDLKKLIDVTYRAIKKATES